MAESGALALEALSINSATEALGVTSSESVGSAMETLLSEGVDPSVVMEGLGEGVLVGEGPVPTDVLVSQAQEMTDLSPPKIASAFESVDRLAIPDEVYADPVFRQEMAQHMYEESLQAKGEVQSKGSVEAMMQRSAQHAQESHAKRQSEKTTPTATEKELERLKREAAIMAVRQQMQQWHKSVDADKRLSPEAKQLAHQKVNRVEQRLVLQTQMTWDGKSLMKMLLVAALWLSE